MFTVKKVFVRTSYIDFFGIKKILIEEGEDLRFDYEFNCVNTYNNHYYCEGFTIIIESEDVEYRLKDLINNFDNLYENGYDFYYKIED